eukprot:SAG11_NODE_608_length_8226_cov_4.489603_5_plen_65_part_00
MEESAPPAVNHDGAAQADCVGESFSAAAREESRVNAMHHSAARLEEMGSELNTLVHAAWHIAWP